MAVDGLVLFIAISYIDYGINSFANARNTSNYNAYNVNHRYRSPLQILFRKG